MFPSTYDSFIGEGRTRIQLKATHIGKDLLVVISNENAHLGAVAIGEFDQKSQRTSVSVITRLGHKDDSVARNAAYSITKATQISACVIAGIHLDDISEAEIGELVRNSQQVVKILIGSITKHIVPDSINQTESGEKLHDG